MTRASLSRTLLALVLLAGQLSAALCGVGHVHGAAAASHPPHEGHEAHAARGPHGAVGSHGPAGEAAHAHTLSEACHLCSALGAATTAPEAFEVVVSSPAVEGARSGGESAPPPPRATHRLPRGPPLTS